MNGFELIALKYDCTEGQYKNLERNRIYTFVEKHPLFTTGQKKVSTGDHINDLATINEIVNNEDIVLDIYNESSNEIKINVSAIVGKNGSGKTSLIELVELFTFLLSVQKKLIRWVDYQDLIDEAELIRLSQYKVEILYTLDGEYYLIRNTGKLFLLLKLVNKKWLRVKFSKEKFFFTISVNYSLYGLNESIDTWFAPLFHRNDGYKTPITIVPYRKLGQIDINNEYHLAQSRILSSFVDEHYNNPVLIDDKNVSRIDFSFNSKTDFKIKNQSLRNIYLASLKTGVDILNEVKTVLEQHYKNLSLHTYCEKLKEKYDEGKYSGELDYQTHLFEYIVYKIIKIPITYFEHFNDEIHIDKEGNLDCINLRSTLKKVINHKSHITLKLNQATNTLRFAYFSNYVWKNLSSDDWEISMDVQTFIDLIKNHKKKDTKRNLVEFIPGAFFKPSFVIAKDENDHSFFSLSSGEQQTIQSIQAIQYHVSNIDTIDGVNSYKSINLFLDEIELYSHPEYQRMYLSRLLTGLKNLRLNKIKNINIIFSTHSPFILSDIPHYSLLQMKDGQPIKTLFNKTFGANLYDLLLNNFFLENGTIGEVADGYITEVITKVKNVKSTDDVTVLKKSINIISEDVIREKLLQMLAENTLQDDELISYHLKQIEIIKKSRDNDKN